MIRTNSAWNRLLRCGMPSRNAHWTAQKKAAGLRFSSKSLLLSWSRIRMIRVSYCQERDIIVERQKTHAWEHLQRWDRCESSGLLPSCCGQSNCSQCNWSLSVVSLTSKTVSLGCSSFADEHSFGCRLYRCSFKAKYFISDSRWGKTGVCTHVSSDVTRVLLWNPPVCPCDHLY